jgi:hypothetical protein
MTPEDRKLVLDTLSGNFYLNYARARQYVLLRLDAALSGGEATYAYKTITVEHVLPQRPAPGSVWTKWFPTTELNDRWVHHLGNLVLLSRSKNMDASNYDFDRKKRTYFATRDGVSPFALTTQVLQEKSWTPEVVERR